MRIEVNQLFHFSINLSMETQIRFKFQTSFIQVHILGILLRFLDFEERGRGGEVSKCIRNAWRDLILFAQFEKV